MGPEMTGVSPTQQPRKSRKQKIKNQKETRHLSDPYKDINAQSEAKRKKSPQSQIIVWACLPINDQSE
jgi:hypothetical protein